MARKSKDASPKPSQPKSADQPPHPQSNTPEPEHHDTLAATAMEQEPTR